MFKKTLFIASTLLLAHANVVSAVGSSITGTGIAGSAQEFTNIIAQSSNAVENAMQQMQADYLSKSAALTTDTVYTFSTSSGDTASRSSPIATIRYGFVNSWATDWIVAGDDNEKMYALEVTFKTLANYPSQHPLLAGKTVLFIAHGTGVNPPTIYTTSTTPSSSVLSDPDTMSAINGFTCFLKASRCNGVKGSIPSNECTDNATHPAVNSSERPGVYTGTADATAPTVNFFHFVNSGPFAACGNSIAERDSMGAA